MTSMTDANAIRFVTITGPEADELPCFGPLGCSSMRWPRMAVSCNCMR